MTRQIDYKKIPPHRPSISSWFSWSLPKATPLKSAPVGEPRVRPRSSVTSLFAVHSMLGGINVSVSTISCHVQQDTTSVCHPLLPSESNSNSIFVAVNVSFARQPFVHICEGKNQLTMQKIPTHQTLYRLDNELQHQPPKDLKNRTHDDQELWTKVSKLFKGTIISLTILLLDGFCCVTATRRTNEDVGRWMEWTRARDGMQRENWAPASLGFTRSGIVSI